MSGEIDTFANRRGLTFAQAEGTVPLPTQLALRELPSSVRARLAKVIFESLETDYEASRMGGVAPWVKGNWRRILYDKHVLFENQFPGDFSYNFKESQAKFSAILRNASYDVVSGHIQFVLQHEYCPNQLARQVEWALRSTNAAYRVVEGGLIVPVASDIEGQAVAEAFKDLKAKQFDGARTHLEEAGKQLSGGAWADSVRESIHAVETVAKLLEPSAGTLGPALHKLSQSQHPHFAKRGHEQALRLCK